MYFLAHLNLLSMKNLSSRSIVVSNVDVLHNIMTYAYLALPTILDYSLSLCFRNSLILSQVIVHFTTSCVHLYIAVSFFATENRNYMAM